MLLHQACFHNAQTSGLGRIPGRSAYIKCYQCNQIIPKDKVVPVSKHKPGQSTMDVEEQPMGQSIVSAASRARVARNIGSHAALAASMLEDPLLRIPPPSAPGMFGHAFQQDILRLSGLHQLRKKLLSNSSRSDESFRSSSSSSIQLNTDQEPMKDTEDNGPESDANGAGPSFDLPEQPSAIRVKGMHSSKISSLVKCLKLLQKTQPGAKSLVFSQWDSALFLCQIAFEENGINSVQMGKRVGASHRRHGQSSDPVSVFKSDNDTTVMLIRFGQGHGAEGVTLEAATHIFFLEPSLSPAQERQAIGRAYRMGQSNNVVVHRLISLGTVEEAVH